MFINKCDLSMTDKLILNESIYIEDDSLKHKNTKKIKLKKYKKKIEKIRLYYQMF